MIAPEAITNADWRKQPSYQYLDQLAKRDWSWEGLRRNGQLGSDWADASSYFHQDERLGAATVLNCDKPSTALDRWGVVFCDPPEMDARHARVLWRPEYYSAVLSMTASVAKASDGTHCFSLRDLECPSLVLLRPGDQQHILFLHEGRGLQLAVTGASVLKPVQLMIDASPSPIAARRQLELLKCFIDLGITGRMKPQYGMKKIAPRRLKTVLQALDGAIAGASHREIALAIYGQNRVDTDWNDPKKI